MKTSDLSDEAVLRAFVLSKQEIDSVQTNGSVSLNKNTPWPYTILMRDHNAPFKVAWRAMERVLKRGLVDYGVSLRTGWLTAEGEAFLTQLDRNTADHLKT